MNESVLRYRIQRHRRKQALWHWKVAAWSTVPILGYLAYVMVVTGTTPAELVRRFLWLINSMS